MSTNELSVVITQEKNDAVHQLLGSILAELDFLRDLSVEDRKGLVKMGRKNLDFVERCYRHAEGSPQYLFSFMAIEEFKKDIDYFRWLRDVERKLFVLSMCSKGCTRHEAVHLVEVILMYLLYNAIQQDVSFDSERYKFLLRKYKRRKPRKIHALLAQEFKRAG